MSKNKTFIYLVVIVVTTLVSVSCNQDQVSSPNQINTTTSNNQTSEQTTLTEQLSGTFIGAEKPTEGKVTIVNENGQNYLEFDQTFQTGNGPDLFVLLHRDDNPQSYESEKYFNLGELKSKSGTQRYEIPIDVNLTDYRSVVIWCRQFNVTFAYANL